MVMWDRRVVEKVKEFVANFTMACSFRSVEDNLLWAFTEVYGLNMDNECCLLWEELVGVLSWWNLPMCIGGDFNIGFQVNTLVLVSWDLQ